MAGENTTQKKQGEAKAVIAPKKTTARKSSAPAKKSTTRTTTARKMNKGDTLLCGVCGLSVIVDDFGDVVGAEELICCGQPMKKKASRAKASAK